MLALVVAWGWPPVAQSRTPDATSVVLAVSALAIVLSALVLIGWSLGETIGYLAPQRLRG